MKRAIRGLTVILVLSLTALLYIIASAYLSLVNKSEYSVLQLIENQERDVPINDVVLKTVEGYAVAGFPSQNNKGNVWLLLHPKHSPYYNQVPQYQFSITSETMNKIRSSSEASDTVIAVLETRVSDGGNYTARQ